MQIFNNMSKEELDVFYDTIKEDDYVRNNKKDKEADNQYDE